MSDVLTWPDAYHHPALFWLLSKEPVMPIPTNQVIVDEVLDPATGRYQLKNKPLPGTLVLKDVACYVLAKDNGKGEVRGLPDDREFWGTVNYETGMVSLSCRHLVRADYQYDPDMDSATFKTRPEGVDAIRELVEAGHDPTSVLAVARDPHAFVGNVRMPRTFEVRADNRGHEKKERFVTTDSDAHYHLRVRIRISELCEMFRKDGFSITEVVEILPIPDGPFMPPKKPVSVPAPEPVTDFYRVD